MRTGFMDVRIQTWNEVSSEEIARFIFQVRGQEGRLNENTTIDNYLSAVEWWTNRSNSTPISAYINNRLVGWLVFFSFVQKIGTIGRWHPVVEEGPQKEAIAAQLLEASITHAKQNSFERLEAELTGITPEPETESLYELYKRWFEAQGMHLASEEFRLERDLTQDLLLEPVFPAEYKLVPLSQFTNEELQKPFFEMFDNSHDRFWLDQTVDQRVESFNFWFDRERPFVEEATTILIKRDKIIGLTVVRPVQEVGMLGPIGILPHYRRRGLGRALMRFSLLGARKAGFSKVQLEFDITNEPAFRLYKELGFKHVHRLAIFALVL